MKKNLLNILASLAIYLCLTTIVMSFAVPAFAQDVTDIVRGIGTQTSLPSFDTGHAQSSYEPGAGNITSAILFAVDLLKYLMGTIAVLVIIASGVRLVTAGKKIDEIAPKMKENLKYAIIGLIVIIMADTMVKQVFFGEQGEVFRSETDAKLAAQRGTDQIRGLYNFMEMFMGALAVLMIVLSGFRLVTSGGKDEEITKSKRNITYAVIALILVGVAEFVVKDVVFPKEGAQLSDVNKARNLIVTITNFISGFVATIAIAMDMYGGFLYVTAAGKEDQASKAKKVLIGATIGLFVAMGAFALVNTVIKFEPIVAQQTQQTVEVGAGGLGVP